MTREISPNNYLISGAVVFERRMYAQAMCLNDFDEHCSLITEKFFSEIFGLVRNNPKIPMVVTISNNKRTRQTPHSIGEMARCGQAKGRLLIEGLECSGGDRCEQCKVFSKQCLLNTICSTKNAANPNSCRHGELLCRCGSNCRPNTEWPFR